MTAQVLPEHKKMLKALGYKFECSRAEVIRTLIEDAYAEAFPNGPLQPSRVRRFVATDGRVYFKTRHR